MNQSATTERRKWRNVFGQALSGLVAREEQFGNFCAAAMSNGDQKDGRENF